MTLGILLGILIAGAYADTEVNSKRHEAFVPLVAFSCGFRNQYMTEDGGWKTDESRYATCFSGKLDILKYCKKVYPDKNITNIVEYSHDVDVTNWCREEGTPCKWTHNVRPYQCIEGEFPTVALQVPEHCRFSHVSTREKCEDYQYWKEEATKQCGAKKDTNSTSGMVLRSMAVLETCALDMFRGVEFVCCKAEATARENFYKSIDKIATKYSSSEDDDEEEDDDDAESYAEDSDEYDEDEMEQDPYFKAANWTNEHDDFKQAEGRMDVRHRKKVDKVMKQWAQLESRYTQMKKKDPSGAEKFKLSMTERFQKTVASLEEEHKRMRKDIESVHEERVQALLNEKKRDATHDYRQALSTHLVRANKHMVLQSLKTYIRAEEKDRMHNLNRYRHLLRTDKDAALTFKASLIHKLRYIDLRINGTMAMLREFPDLMKYVRPIAVNYWMDYRRENTPELSDNEIDQINSLSEDSKNTRLVDMYEKQYEKTHSGAKLNVKAPSTVTLVHKPEESVKEDPVFQPVHVQGEKVPVFKPVHVQGEKEPVKEESVFKPVHVQGEKENAKVLPTENSSDSEEDDDDYYEDEGDEQIKKPAPASKVISVKPKEKTEKIIEAPKLIETSIQTDSDSSSSSESDEDSEDEDDDEDDEKTMKELRVDIEPIIEERPSFARHDKLVQNAEEKEGFNGTIRFLKSSIFILSAGAILYAVVLFTIRSRRANRGFIEVDVYTPEERHVAGMQVNGYENPTYSFFDSKA